MSIGSPSRIRTSICALKTRGPAIRRTGNGEGGRIRTCDPGFGDRRFRPLSYTNAGLPGWIRTNGLRVRNPVRYPAALREVGGLGGGIRTPDLPDPNRTLYRAKLHLDWTVQLASPITANVAGRVAVVGQGAWRYSCASVCDIGSQMSTLNEGAAA